MKISFGDLRVSGESKKHLEEVVNSNIVSGGPKVKQFEDSWGALFNTEYNIAMSNGTAADIAACMSLYDFGAKRGDEIIVPALAFAAVGNSVLAAGFKPIFVDIKRETMNIDPMKIEEKITPNTRAIMAVHSMGKPCVMDSIKEIAKNYNLRIIEDCCEAYGGRYKGMFNGTTGDVSTFSFYVAHIISCGDGGMVSTNNEEFEKVIRSVKDHGRKPGSLYFNHERIGLNFRMNALVASIGLPEIEKFWKIFNQRKKNFYNLKNQTADLSDLIYFTEEEPHEVLAPHAFSITLKDPKLNYHRLYNFLESKGIECKRNFGSMPTQHKAFEFLGHKLGEFPEAEYVGENGLHFGIHQFLLKEDVTYASNILHEYFKK